MDKQTIDPAQILQVGLGFFASKTLLSAVELEVFTHLGSTGMTGQALGQKIGLHERSRADFLDSLVALGFLGREGLGQAAVYSNTPSTAAFLIKTSPAYMGGILEMANARLYPFWSDLTEALRTGLPQNETKRTGKGLFEVLSKDPAQVEVFMSAMAGVQMGNFMALAEKFDFGKHRTFCDVGGASGALAVQVAKRHPHLRCISFNLPMVASIAGRRVSAAGLAERVTIASGDFFKDPLPRADVISMGNILHDWGQDDKKMLIRKAYESLPAGGAFIAVENVIDNERRQNAFGLLMSLNMLIETPAGFDYTGAQFDAWCREAGFQRTEIIPLTGPTSAAIAYK